MDVRGRRADRGRRFPYVPAGVFLRGTPASQAQALAAQFGEYFAVETPQRTIDLDAYYVDKFEVTNQQYKEFVDRGGYENRQYWKQPFTLDRRPSRGCYLVVDAGNDVAVPDLRRPR